MTTLPTRYDTSFFHRVITSISTQHCKSPFEIVVFLPERSNRFPDVPYASATTAPHRGWTEYRCPWDMGPATKFVGLSILDTAVIQHFSHVVICDDDIILQPGTLARMDELVRTDPSAVWANFTYPVRDAPYEMHVEGFGGVVVPIRWVAELKKAMHARGMQDHPVMLGLEQRDHPCYEVDDVLLSYLLSRAGMRIRATGLDAFGDWMNVRETDTHPSWFELSKHTSREEKTRACIARLTPPNPDDNVNRKKNENSTRDPNLLFQQER